MVYQSARFVDEVDVKAVALSSPRLLRQYARQKRLKRVIPLNYTESGQADRV